MPPVHDRYTCQHARFMRSNAATCHYVNGIASSEGLLLKRLRGNPAGSGIHHQMLLVRAGG
jgi:hypothetical protein